MKDKILYNLSLSIIACAVLADVDQTIKTKYQQYLLPLQFH